MPGASYGMRQTTSARDQDLYINVERNVEKFPSYRKEVVKRLDGGVFKDKVKSHKYEWSVRPNRPLTSTLAEAYTSGTSLVVSDPGVFNVDDLIMLGSVQARVTQVTGGVALTVAPVAGGTLAAADVGAAISIVGGATPHGKDADDGITSGFDDYFNYVTNFEAVVNVSSTDNASTIRGRQKASELVSVEQEMLVQKLNRSLLVSKRFKDSVNNITNMGGIIDLVQTYAPSNYVDFGGSAIWSTSTADRDVQDKLDAAFEVISDKAFKKPVMWVGTTFMSQFKHIQNDRTYTTTTPSGKRGVGVVRKYDTHVFGEIDVVQLMGVEDIMRDKIIITDESDIGYAPLVGWRTYPLGKRGQSYQWQVEGMYTFKVGIPEAHVVLHNLGV